MTMPVRASALPLLPPGMLWVYVIAPVGLAVLVSQDLVTGPPWEVARKVAAQYVPFIAFGGAFHLVYRYPMPRLLAGLHSPRAQVAAHLGAVALVALPVAWLVYPVVAWSGGCEASLAGFMATSLVVSAACLGPALLVQQLRLRARAAEREAVAQRQAVLQAQLDALQARTDPHFLFNSLNTVAALIPEDPVKAERVLENLADLFRYALDASRTRTVPLGRELAMVSQYLDLQAARFGDRLSTQVQIDDTLAGIEVPPLLLQPLVENAILHGAARRKRAIIRLCARRAGDALVIEVADDGPGPGASPHAGAGSALAGITERLRLHYAGRGSLALLSPPGGGCLARLILPMAATA